MSNSGRGRGASVGLGSASELEVFTALRRAGYRVSVPMLDGGSPYDCVIDDGERLQRVQIKTGHVYAGAVCWATRSTSYHRTGGTSRDYRGLADLFAIWVPERAECYLVPVEECGRHQSMLRLEPARNNQTKGTRQASDYALRPTRPVSIS